MKKLALFLFTSAFSCADPLLDSWLTELSGRYARLYETDLAEASQSAVTTWSRGQGIQASPTYAGVHEIASDEDFVYIRTTGLGFHVMGPWFNNGNLFPNYPANIAEIFRFPRNATFPSTKTKTSSGPIGYFVDGVAMFDSRDTFSYSTQEGEDQAPGNNVIGNGIWERDAFVSEGNTFDAAFAHPAGPLYHYHANAPALRYLLGDSIDYDVNNNVYSESPNNQHSPIIGWCRDGLPIYGPYGYSDPTDSTSPIRRMISGYQLRDGSNGSANLRNSSNGTDSEGINTGRTSLPAWAVRNDNSIITAALDPDRFGPPTTLVLDSEDYSLGRYLQDWAYKGDLNNFDLYNGFTSDGPFNSSTHFDLNEYNTRFTITPEFPEGTYAYFTNIEEDGTPTFPYNIGRYYLGDPLGITSNSASPADIPATAITHWEGGPEKTLQIQNLEINSTNDDVTFVWTSVEGGQYTIQRTQDLTTNSWIPFAQTNGIDATTPITDPGRARTDDKHFYRVGLNSISPFDDTGFVYEEVGLSQNNVLLLILDDWGIDSSELYNTTNGAALADMPNLRSLLFSDLNAPPTSTPDKGLLFTRGYAQPVCAPTRATLLTGRQPYQHSVVNPTSGGTLPSNELTFPEIISVEAPEYGLASFGKWHLGSGNTGPTETGGWPNFAGSIQGGVDDYANWTKVEIEDRGNPTTNNNFDTYATTDQVNEAISFINAQGSEPWIIWMGFNAPHSPFHDPSPYVTPPNGYSVEATNNTNLYIRMLEALDHEIGNLLNTVDLSKTNIIVIGDNGTPGQVDQAPAGGLAGAKGSLTEGGIHVPFFASGPDVTITGTSDTLVHVADLFTTILDLVNLDSNDLTAALSLHSTSLLPVFSGTDSFDRCIISETMDDNPGRDGRALILDDWPQYKLISRQDVTDANDTPIYEMYELSSDGVEIASLTLPPSSGASYENAYNALIIKDQMLNQASSPTNTQTVFLELPNITGPASPPSNLTIQPLTVTYQNIPVTTIFGRLNQNGTEQRYWVSVALPIDTSIDFNSPEAFTITFSPTPMTQAERVFDAIQIVSP